MSITIKSLGKRFGAVTALAGVDLAIGDDELLVVLGPTGAGKTTLLRCLAGLERPDVGSIHFDAQDAALLSPAQRDVALVFQNFSLYPDWTVRDNLAFPLRAPGRNLDAATIADRIDRAATLLHLQPYLDRPAQRLSGGQMQRVAIGRAIVRTPRVFLMDEPLTNLDAKLREQLRVELAVIRRELKIPMVYVTHDQAEALSMGDRIAVLDQGRILQIGTPEDIYERPVSPTVARLLGQPRIALFSATRHDHRWRSASGADLGLAQSDDAQAATTATIGIRPEHVQLGPGDNATITRIEHLGPVRVCHLDWQGHALTALVDTLQPLTRGQRCSVTIAQHLCWTDDKNHTP